MSDDLRCIAEGICPTCSGPLERREDQGFCATCRCGWSLEPETVTLHIEVLSFEITPTDGSHFRGGPGEAQAVRPLRSR